MSNFNPFEVVDHVDRGSETQLQVGENLNYLFERFRDKRAHNPVKPEFKWAHNPFSPYFTTVTFIHYKPRIAAAILD